MKNVFLIIVILSLLFILFCENQKSIYQFNGKDTVYFRDWLLCGSFPNCPECDPVDYKHDERCKGFYTDYLKSIGGELNAHPQKGSFVTAPDLNLKREWFYYHSETDKIPFNSIFEPNDLVVAYAFCQVNSDYQQKAILSLGSNDGIKVFLNGEKVHENHPLDGRWLQKDNDYVPVALKSGVNNFLFKVDEGTGEFGIVVRLLNYDSTLADIRRNLVSYKALSLVTENDLLVAQFGQPYKIGALHPGGEVMIEIFDEKSKKLREKKGLPGSQLDFLLDYLPNGFLLARATFKTPEDGTIISEKRHFKGKLKRHPAAKMLNSESMPLGDNGEPFFPIGTYGAPAEDYDRLKHAGYNFVVAGTNNLDKVHQAGLKAAVPVHGTKPNWFSAVRDTITKYRNHPAILCWMLFDEPGYNRADLLDIYNIYNIAYKADPYHPSYLVITSNSVYETFGRCCDILCIDTYPIEKGKILGVGDNIASALAVSENNQPIWHCGQMFKWPAQRRPTPQEHRSMTYLALIEGAKGVLWYTYKGYGQYLPEDDPALWQAHKKLLHELHELSPLWMASGCGEQVAVTDEGLPIRARLKKCASGTWLIAVNTSKTEACTPEFILNQFRNTSASVFGTDRTLTISNGRLKDHFQPLDVHIYKIK